MRYMACFLVRRHYHHMARVWRDRHHRADQQSATQHHVASHLSRAELQRCWLWSIWHASDQRLRVCQFVHWLCRDLQSSRWRRSQRHWRRRLRHALDLSRHGDVDLRARCHSSIYQQQVRNASSDRIWCTGCQLPGLMQLRCSLPRPADDFQHGLLRQQCRKHFSDARVSDGESRRLTRPRRETDFCKRLQTNLGVPATSSLPTTHKRSWNRTGR